jgi:hypothetical protein
VNMTEPAVGNRYLDHSGGWRLRHLPPVALLALTAPGVDVLVHGLPHKSARDEEKGRPCPWMSNVMQSSEDAWPRRWSVGMTGLPTPVEMSHRMCRPPKGKALS